MFESASVAIGVGTTTPQAKLHVSSSVPSDTLFRTDGTNGTLFTIVDDLSDSLMSVNNSAGLPVLEVFADDRVVAGQYGQNDLVVTNNRLGVGTSAPANKLHVSSSSNPVKFEGLTSSSTGYYLTVDNTTGVVYKTSTGPQGAQGAQGAVGSQGAQGAVGSQGAQGAVGSQGAQGAKGSTGVQGAQGAQGAVGSQGAQGAKGSTGVQGAQGAQGAVGSQGAQGAKGSTGVQGAQGAQGAVGSQGAQGAKGSTGVQGAQGAQGAVGNNGAQGAQGAVGSQGAQGATGVSPGGTTGYLSKFTGTTTIANSIVFESASTAIGINTTTPTAELEVKSTVSGSSIFNATGVNGILFNITDDLSDSLMSVNTIAGFPVLEVFADNRVVMGQYNRNDLVVSGSRVGVGVASPTTELHISSSTAGVLPLRVDSLTSNSTGYYLTVDNTTGVVYKTSTGPQGAQGAQGAVGSQGAQGAKGDQGGGGAQGAQGAKGSTGVQGAQGAQGAVGSQGAQGAVGSQGAQGAVGSQGAQGAVGSQGAQGAVGSQGAQGAKGSTGVQGAQGAQGAVGSQGAQGAKGSTGVQGAQGAQGAVGSQGAQGAKGSTGVQGAQGAQGAVGSQGAQGAKGDQGGGGAQGAQGAKGDQGGGGAQGAQGAVGSQGAQGATGVSPGGTAGYLARFTGSTTLGNSIVYDTLTNVGVGTTTPLGKLDVVSTSAGSTVINARGVAGNLFSVTDSLSGSLFSVNTAAGFPVMEAFSDSRVNLGQYNQNDLVVTGNRVGVGTAAPTNKLHVSSSAGNPVKFEGLTSSSTGYYLTVDNTSGVVYKTSTGPQGAQGAQGAKGDQGGGGAQGAQGAVGSQGAQGAKGSTGVQGAQGAQGAVGSQGAQGAKGSTGVQGAQGAQGAVGSQGAQGAKGAQGAQGASGSSGNSVTGAQGAQGGGGVQGAQGAAATITNNVNDYVVTMTGTGINGEANLTFDGNNLYINGTVVQDSATQSISGTAALTIDVQSANLHVISVAAGTVSSSITYNNRSNNPRVNTLILVFKYSGTHTITWTNVLWANGVTPTVTGVSGYADVYMLTSYQGGAGTPSWIGTVVAQALVSTSL